MISRTSPPAHVVQLKNVVAPKPIARAPLAAFARARLRAKVAMVTCSETWTETAAEAAEKSGIDPDTTNVSAQLCARGIYPPKPDAGPALLARVGAVRMKRCDGCGRITPPNNVASYRLVRLCDDCRIEPDADLDESAGGARAPGAQLRTLVEGAVNGEFNREAARDKLAQIGLTDAEVMALAMTHAGYSTRRVAEMGRWSQSYVRKLLKSAAKKLQRSGLAVPKGSSAEVSHRDFRVDPVKLDAMTPRVLQSSLKN
jgi:hypothetical protein